MKLDELMKGYKLKSIFYCAIALSAISYLTFFGEGSWSENALKHLNSILNLALINIMLVFIELANGLPNKREVIHKWFGIEIRLMHLCYFTGWGFGAICIANLDSMTFPDLVHMIVTGLAITGLYLIMAGIYKTWSKDWWGNMILINIGVAMLIISFGSKLIGWKQLWLVKDGEYAIAIAGLYQIFRLLFKNHKQKNVKI